MGAVSNLLVSLSLGLFVRFRLLQFRFGWRDHRVNPNPSSNCDTNFERRVESSHIAPHRIAPSVAVDVDVEVDTGPH